MPLGGGGDVGGGGGPMGVRGDIECGSHLREPPMEINSKHRWHKKRPQNLCLLQN